MSDTTAYRRQVADAYFGVMQRSAELLIAISGKDRDIKDTIEGMQTAHLALVRRNFEILQTARPVEKRQTFAQYLRDAAVLYEAAEMAIEKPN